MNTLKNIAKVCTAVFSSALVLGSCTEKIDDSNLYTFTGETILDYLSNRPDFSNFKYIVEKAGMASQMSAYGSYTCFAPNNAAVTHYIDSLYDDNESKDPHNGMTARGLEGLTDSLCVDIARYHFSNTQIMGVNMSNGMTISTFLGRDINTSIDPSGKTVINTYAAITSMDNELENGVLHEISRVITRSNNLVSGELSKRADMTIFARALKETGLMDSLNAQKRDFTPIQDRKKFYVPAECKIGYTVFAETDKVFAENGIKSFDDLVQKCNEWYGHAADAYDNVKQYGWYDYYRNNGIKVSTADDYTNPCNCLYMFVAYHILKFSASYDKLFISWNEVTGVPLYEYYETMLPNTLMKLEYTKSTTKKVINPWYLNGTLTDRVAQLGSEAVKIEKKPGILIENANIQALNGYIHPINGILLYDYDVPNGVLQERMRFDFLNLMPEMATNGFRGIKDEEVKALNGGEEGQDGNLGGCYVRVPTDYCTNVKIYNGENTRLYYLPGRWDQNNSWSNYQADELNCKGAYDFAYRLPPVPDGTYELRIGYTANGNRGMLQFYLGSDAALTSMTALDIPLDMRVVPAVNADGSPDITTGWCDWSKTDDQGVESDAAMRNLGYMRGPLYYTVGGSTKARSNAQDLRRIITQRTFKQQTYWLRFKSVLPKNDATQFHLDYIELCPEKVYNSTSYVEDMF